MSTVEPKDAAPQFPERAFDRQYALYLLCLALYFDAVFFALTGDNVWSLKVDRIDKDIAFGKVLVSVVGYLLLMRAMLGLRRQLIGLFWKPLCWIHTRKYHRTYDPDYVPLSRVATYARNHANGVLFELVKLQLRAKRETQLLADLRFSACVFAFIDWLWPGLFLNTVPLQVLPVAAALVAVFFAVVFLAQQLLRSMVPYYEYDDYIYLPDHPLSEERRKEKEARDTNASTTIRDGAGCDANDVET